METKKGQRFSDILVEQVVELGAEVLAMACSYCILNFRIHTSVPAPITLYERHQPHSPSLLGVWQFKISYGRINIFYSFKPRSPSSCTRSQVKHKCPLTKTIVLLIKFGMDEGTFRWFRCVMSVFQGRQGHHCPYCVAVDNMALSCDNPRFRLSIQLNHLWSS